jgi:hypothetical protein
MSEHWINPRIREFNAWMAENTDLLCPLIPTYVGSTDTSWVHFAIIVNALDGSKPDAKERCLLGATKALEILAHGLTTFVRVAPEAEAQTNFESNRRMTRGYVRFAVTNKEGAWTWPEPDPEPRRVRYLPLPQLLSK